MKRAHLIGGILTAAVLAAGGYGIEAALADPAAQPGPPAATATAGVQIGTAALPPGTALVDATGRALYLFEADQGGMSACTGACAQVWPPLLTAGAAPVAAGAVQAQLIGSVTRPDGTQQVTYNGHPLYYFTGDKNPGEARGQGLDRFGAPWYVVTSVGNKIDPDDDAADQGPAAAPAPRPAPIPAPAAGGYGY